MFDGSCRQWRPDYRAKHRGDRHGVKRLGSIALNPGGLADSATGQRLTRSQLHRRAKYITGRLIRITGHLAAVLKIRDHSSAP